LSHDIFFCRVNRPSKLELPVLQADIEGKSVFFKAVERKALGRVSGFSFGGERVLEGDMESEETRRTFFNMTWSDKHWISVRVTG
jgi:hypothetical protein